MKKNNLKLKIATGVTLLLVGTLVLLSDTIKEKRDIVFSEMNLALSELQEEVMKEEPTTDVIIDTEPVKEEKKEEYTYEKYLGILSIPKINFYKGFYNKNSNLNKVNFNLYVLPQSSYPDIDKGNLMIAGHSGNYSNSYFKNLYLLNIDDEVTIEYNNKNYIYKIEKIYNEPKIGKVNILRDTSKTTLTLITCTKDDEYHQTIYIAYLNKTV